MSQRMKNVMLMGAGGLFGTEVLAALQAEPSFTISILSRKSSKSTFPSHLKVHTTDDEQPISQLISAFKGQDALVSTLPGRPHTTHLRMIDAAIQAGVKRFIPTEYGNNTCPKAASLVPLYGAKAQVIAYLKSHESSTDLTWTAVHTGQFLDWGLESGWLGYDLQRKKALVFDSGDAAWSTTTIGMAATAVVRVLLRPEETRNRAVHVASFTLTQRRLLAELEKATGDGEWDVERISAEEAERRAKEMDYQDKSEGLKLLVLLLLYADGVDRGADFEKRGWLDNEMLGMPVEDLTEVVERVVRQSQQRQQ